MKFDAGSLTFRLAATSALWVAGTLLAVGLLLVYLFRDHIERRFDSQLGDHMEELVAASEISPDKKLKLTWTPTDPRFHRPYSGWYWQIKMGDTVLLHSKSLWRDKLALPAATRQHKRQILAIAGPGKQQLRALTQTITLPEVDHHFQFTIAGPVANIEHDVSLFTRQLILTLGILALALVTAILLQVRFGLRPLRDLRREISNIRTGRTQRVPTTVPSEVTPVVNELNALLDHNNAMLEKARAQAANLAHALKNPLTVMSLEAGEVDGQRGKILRDQASIVTRHIERHLSRAQAAGKLRSRNARTALAPVLEDLQFSMQLLYKARNLDISMSGLDSLFFKGDAHDAEEMLGNLFDNACKWTKKRVQITGRTKGKKLFLAIEGDGPGIPEEHIDNILERGLRRDETVAGSGLGLDIVSDIAELYEGRLTLSRSRLGGLKAELQLPAAAN